MHKTNENKMFHKSKHILKQDNYKKNYVISIRFDENIYQILPIYHTYKKVLLL